MIRVLSLGDSYTIGEGLPFHQNFPSRLVKQLRKKQISAAAPEVIAQTGWTTDELLTAISGYQFLPPYDLVSLLIGVNNEYRGRPTESFKQELKLLLEIALLQANGDASKVFLLSIPDYSCTPFAGQLAEKEKISGRIDAYNLIIRKHAAESGLHAIDITDYTRRVGANPDYLAEDKLHYSAKVYQYVAEAILANYNYE